MDENPVINKANTFSPKDDYDGNSSSSLMKKLRTFIADITKIPNIEKLKFPELYEEHDAA